MLSEVSFAFAIPHTPWIPERVESLCRLVDGLGKIPESWPSRIFGERSPNWAWSGAMWRWGAEMSTSHFLTLQDDVRVRGDEFWVEVTALARDFPDDVICLETVHPATQALARQGYQAFSTSDLLVGVGYMLPTAKLQAFLRWRDEELKPGAVERIPEDTLLALWCVCTGQRIVHPIPAPIDHDVSLASSYGNDSHALRRPPVRFDNYEIPEDDLLTDDVPHIGRVWDLSTLGQAHCKSPPDLTAYVRDQGRPFLRRLAARERADLALAHATDQARLAVCVPTRDAVHPETVNSLLRLAGAIDLDVDVRVADLDTRLESADVVIARSRMIRDFLEGDATHLLFVDADVSFEPAAVYGMLASGHDFVQAPYPKRGVIDWEAIARSDDPRPITARGHRYVILTSGPWVLDEHHCAEIMGTGLGLTLLSRACLQALVDHYRPQLEVDDRGKRTVLVTAHLLAKSPKGATVMLSEDLSLAERWRQMGRRVVLYLGPGSPASHHGDFAWRGQIESLGLRRTPA